MSDPTTTAELVGSDDAPSLGSAGFSGFHDTASPALRTVVAAVRAALADDAPVSLATDADWDLVRSIATRHQVTPLVYEGLSEADAPASVVESLREEVQRNAKRNLQSTAELLRILESFENAGIRAIPVKGPVLAATAYGDPNRRMFGDLDVLVPVGDAVAAGRVLRSDGYEPDAEFGLLRRFGSDFPLLADVSECSFHHERHGEVELRWRQGHWANPLATSFDDWWDRRETTTLAGREVPVLSPEDRLLVLATHANKHAWRRLAWLADVAATVRAHGNLDWDVLDRRATSWGVATTVHVAVVLAGSLSAVAAESIPAATRERVREDRLAGLLADRAASRLARDPLGAPSRVEEVAYDLAGTGSVRTVPRMAGRAAAASIRQLLLAVAARASR